MKRYGRDFVKEFRTLEKIDFKHKKTILHLQFLISLRKSIYSLSKSLLNQEVNNKEQAVKMF